MDYTEAIALGQTILDDLPDLPQKAEDFVASAEDTVLGIMENVEEHSNVTAGQVRALENIRAGVDKWLHRGAD